MVNSVANYGQLTDSLGHGEHIHIWFPIGLSDSENFTITIVENVVFTIMNTITIVVCDITIFIAI